MISPKFYVLPIVASLIVLLWILALIYLVPV